MKKKSVFTFKAFDEKKFRSTAETWTREAAEGMAFPSEIEQLLAWAKDHLETKEGQATAYGVFPNGSTVADAICEVVVWRKSIKSKWIKMLRIRLRPRVDNALNSPGEAANEGMREALEIFVQSTIGLLKFGVAQKANTIKVYGRTSQQLNFLRFLGIELEKIAHNPLKTSVEGKFLVVQAT